MKLSAKSKYGILGLTEILNSDAKMMSVREIAKKHSISEKFLESCFTELKKNSVLILRPGKNGGCRAAKKASALSVFEVLSCLEGDVKIAEPDFEESEIKEFIFDNVWQKINDDIEEKLKNIYFE